MSIIRITYYGHSCFKVEKESYSIVLDPYAPGSVPGLHLPQDLRASRVICSHGHADHNAEDQITLFPAWKREITAEFLTVPHDDAGGSLRGMNNIAILNTGRLKIVHFGDIGRLCTEEEYARLEGADILMIPCGGYFTIDAAQAKEIAGRIEPKTVILMHYRTGTTGYEVLASLKEVEAVFRNLQETGSQMKFEENQPPEGVFAMRV